MKAANLIVFNEKVANLIVLKKWKSSALESFNKKMLVLNEKVAVLNEKVASSTLFNEKVVSWDDSIIFSK